MVVFFLLTDFRRQEAPQTPKLPEVPKLPAETQQISDIDLCRSTLGFTLNKAQQQLKPERREWQNDEDAYLSCVLLARQARIGSSVQPSF